MFDYKIFDTLLEPVFVINKERKIIYLNEPAAGVCEASVRKLIKTGVFDQDLKFAEPLTFLKDLENLYEASPYQEVGFSSVNGKQGKAQITCQPLGQEYWVVYFRDVTLEETLQKKYRAELEQVQHYSKNLEKMVDERTAEIKKLNSTMSALLDSLHQGFFLFDREGQCLEVYSKACKATIECEPAGRKIWEVLKLDSPQIPGFQKWLTTLFLEMLPFEDLAVLGPANYPHSQGRHVKLDYYPLHSDEGKMTAIVGVATDITNLIEAQKEAETERANAKLIMHLVKNRKHVGTFIREARELLTALEYELKKGIRLDLEATFRYLHTLKGGAASFSIKIMTDICHEAETYLSTIRGTQIGDFAVEKLRKFTFQIEEKFLLFQMDNLEIIGDESQLQERWVENPVSKLVEFRSKHLSTLPTESQMFTDTFIMEPIISSFEHFQEVVSNVAKAVSKELAPIRWFGGDLRVIPEPYDSLFATLIHAFRNAVDHGIEPADVRVQNRKTPEGHITVKFQKIHSLNSEVLLIHIEDDGGGINPAIIRNKLKAKGMDTSGESDDQVIQHIFDSQFSTKDQVTEISGRGVGMDAITHAAAALGGRAWVVSRLGKGTSLFVQVPFLRDWSKRKETGEAA